MPRSLTGRIVLVVMLTMLAAWLAMGLALTIILASLHADATRSSLADIGQTLVVRFRNVALDRDLRTIVADLREGVAGSGISIHLLRGDGSYADLGETAGTTSPTVPVQIPSDATRGKTLTGDLAFSDGTTHLYAATVLRAPGVAGPRAIVLSLPDTSRAAAFADLVRALPAVLLVSAAVGLPLALVLSRSVGGPLRRLAEATADLPLSDSHRPLPLDGPAEVRELTARFNAMAEELGQSRRREAELLADLRHDLRTPLTVIAGFATALADGTATGEDAIRASHTIGEEARRLERLVDELGAVERLRRGAEGLRPETIDVADLLASTIDRFRSVAVGAGVELAIAETVGGATRPRDAIQLVADRGALDRIMANLVTNALSAAPSPGGHVWLSASLGGGSPSHTNQSVVLAVTDDGLGFPPGTAARAFERFFRGDPARSNPGGGLGLAIVREFALAHGGTAHAENVAPHGARVSVVLPRIPPAR